MELIAKEYLDKIDTLQLRLDLVGIQVDTLSKMLKELDAKLAEFGDSDV